MSASTEKKLRAQAREEGSDKKAVKFAEEEKKAAKTKRNITIASVIIILAVVLILLVNTSILHKNTTALTVGDMKFTPADVNYAYSTAFSNFYNTYGEYASMFGLDTTYGLSGLASQNCGMMEEEGSTWRDYFLDSAVTSLKQYAAMCKYADENGITLTEEEEASLNDSLATLEESVKSYGYTSLNKYLSGNFGKGVDKDTVLKYERMSLLASKAYSQICAEVEAADTGFEDYTTKNFRHILIKAVADENGEYTDAAKAEAKAKCEELLKQWEAGDKTEESFAALAEENSEDTGSNTNGGLYEDVYKGQMITEINDFIYDPARKVGDTAICYSGDDASYCGYHVVYFSGDGCKYSETDARASEIDELASPVIEELTDALTEVKGWTMKLVGKG